MITVAVVIPESVQPLLTWAIVAGLCSLLLVSESGLLWWRSYHKRLRRLLRGCAVAAVVIAVASVIFAQHSLSAYLDFSAHGVPGRSPPLAAVLAHEQMIMRMLAFDQRAGWTVVGLTAALQLVIFSTSRLMNSNEA